MKVGDNMRVKDGFGYLSGCVGVVVELPQPLDHNRPIPDTAFATLYFEGEIPAHHRCDPDILEPSA